MMSSMEDFVRVEIILQTRFEIDNNIEPQKHKHSSKMSKIKRKKQKKKEKKS